MDRSLHQVAAVSLRPLLATVVLTAAALMAGLTVTPAGTASAATVPPGMLGMNDWALPSEQTLASVHRAGTTRWRAGLFWHYVENTRGARYWGDYDKLVAASARQGVSLLLVVAGCPPWACSSTAGPPRTPDATAAQRDFLRDAVARYGSNGSFWNAHPELPRRPVTDWQVANEVNSSEFWKPGPDPAGYARFLREQSAVIRGADPRATIVMSGLTEYGQVRVADYLRQLYRQPGFRQSFDVLAVHAYAPDAPAVGRLLDRTRKVAVDNGDAGRPMWVTEMGWGTSSPRLATPTSPAQQADLMRKSFDMMIGCRERWNLDRAYWFAYKDLATQPGQPDLAANHTGLFDLAGRAKPAWGTFQRYRGGAGVAGASTCRLGDSRAPRTAIKARKRFRAVRRARMRLVANERGARFQCRLVRAVKRRSAPSARRARRWRKCRRSYRTPSLKPGGYRLDVRAKDRAGNVDRTPARARVRLRRGQRVTVTVRVLRPRRAR